MKERILICIKYFGLFAVCRFLTARMVRILCYHGISVSDEHKFRPLLFMSAENFRRQMKFLERKGYPIIPLADVNAYLDGRQLPKCSTIITIDDGWYGTYKFSLPILTELGFAATIYVTSYYAEKNLPVYNMIVQYLFWRTDKTECDLGTLGFGLTGKFVISDPGSREAAVGHLLEMDRQLGAEDRHDLTRRLASLLGVEFNNELRLICLMTPEEIRTASEASDIDIQLHTHRHRMGAMTRDELAEEIDENREALKPFVQNELLHFCYPSGNYDPKVWPYLNELGIRSATTTEQGLVTRQSPKFGLKRILLSNTTSDILFEAELCGLLEILRTLRSALHLNPFKSGESSNQRIERA